MRTQATLQAILDILPPVLAKGSRGEAHQFDREYWKWEEYAQVVLNCLCGYTDFHWWSSDSDSCGPLVRSVTAVRNGQKETASYG
jgi:hypothetical protein